MALLPTPIRNTLSLIIAARQLLAENCRSESFLSFGAIKWQINVMNGSIIFQ
jgi:hypothetical protein